MKKAYLAISILFTVLVILPGISVSLDDLSSGYNQEFITMDYAVLFLLPLLVLYNLALFGVIKRFKTIFGYGLIIFMALTIFGLYVGSSSIGGFNQLIAFLGIAVTSIFLAITLLNFRIKDKNQISSS